MKLEDLQTISVVNGIVPNAQVTAVSVQWFGSDATDWIGAFETIHEAEEFITNNLL